MPPAPMPLVGKQFDRLFVIAELGMIHGNQRQFLCVCDCAQQTIVSLKGLRTRHTRSCGCLHPDVISAAAGSYNRRHGKVKSAEYKVHQGMLNRCYNPNVEGYPNYGGRGIEVCERWRNFRNFIADMGPRPSAKHSLDRYPDQNGHYEPGNVRWATSAQQARNLRTNVKITAFGLTKTLPEWTDEYPIGRTTLRRRILTGWTPELALTTPPWSIRRKLNG